MLLTRPTPLLLRQESPVDSQAVQAQAGSNAERASNQSDAMYLLQSAVFSL